MFKRVGALALMLSAAAALAPTAAVAKDFYSGPVVMNVDYHDHGREWREHRRWERERRDWAWRHRHC